MNRRKLLAGGAAALPLAVVGVSTVEAAPVAVNPLDRVISVARELSQALADWNGELFGGGPWIARVYPAGSISHPISLEDIGATASPIADLFDQWRKLHEADLSEMTDADCDALVAMYQRLQSEIIEATPRTPRDVAMQFWCDCDAGASAHSEDFKSRMRALAGVGALAS